MVLLTVRRSVYDWFRPTIDAFFTWNLAWKYRWRLLALLPISLITYSIGKIPYLFRRPFTEEWIPVTKDRSMRVLIFKASGTGRGRKLRPLHIDIHGGAFIGGVPENNAHWNERIARETGAVVVLLTYRFAPVHVFPAAHDDVDAAVRWLQEHAEERYGADPTLVTVSGDSAGGNLALAASQQEGCHAPAATAFKGSLIFYGAIDLRLMPIEKPVPEKFPKKDPLSFLLPLFDSYPGPVRSKNMENPRMSPCLAKAEMLPENVLVCIAGIDILVHEQEAFVERVKKEFEEERFRGRKIDMVFDPDGFHGYLALPDAVVPAEKKEVMFGPGIEFITDIHRKYGWHWEK